MAQKPWRVIPRPLLETVLNNFALHGRVTQNVVLHGPRGTGKTTLILERLLDKWNKGPHVTGYVDFAQSMKDHHSLHQKSFPWTSWSNCPSPPLPSLRSQLEVCLESMAEHAIKIGAITSSQIFSTLNKWHSLSTALRRIIDSHGRSRSGSDKAPASVLWDRAVSAFSASLNSKDLVDLGKGISKEESMYLKNAFVSLKLAKEVICMQQRWRANAVAHLNSTGRFSRSLAHSATDWPCLLLELLSSAAEIDHFQPKLVLNNIDVLRNAHLTDNSTVCASMYHDSLLWRLIALGVNEQTLPVILVTSDSYYSFEVYLDFGFSDLLISRETFGWTPAEAELHMVPDYFSPSELKVVSGVLGSSPRHLFELYALKQSNHYQMMMGEINGTYEDIVDAYLAYLQITAVNPAMDKAISILEKFARDSREGKISKDKLRFGAPWRRPPQTDDPAASLEWAKLQLMDFVQCLVHAGFAVNYLADESLEFFDDPSALAMLEVGLLYTQYYPNYIRPVSRGIQRCLVRWLVQERMQMNIWMSLQFFWQRFFRGRSYRHLMLQYGYFK